MTAAIAAGALVLAVAVVAIVVVRNGLVARHAVLEQARAQVDVQLRRRHDLVPALVTAVRGQLQHERDLVKRLAELRAAAVASTGQEPRRVGPPENGLTAGLQALTAVVERHPTLRGSASVLRLQEDLLSTENRIAFARQHHNDAVMLYNTARGTFPRVLLAAGLGFPEAAYLELNLPDRTS